MPRVEFPGEKVLNPPEDSTGKYWHSRFPVPRLFEFETSNWELGAVACLEIVEVRWEMGSPVWRPVLESIRCEKRLSGAAERRACVLKFVAGFKP